MQHVTPRTVILVRVVIARCQVDYAGRLTAHLPLATRLLLVKADGSVLVHADGGSYKPLNWMSPPCTLTESPNEWLVVNKAGEFVGIIFDGNIYSLSGDYAYEDVMNRAISVASPAVIESLNHVFDAGFLADELLNGKRK